MTTPDRVVSFAPKRRIRLLSRAPTAGSSCSPTCTFHGNTMKGKGFAEPCGRVGSCSWLGHESVSNNEYVDVTSALRSTSTHPHPRGRGFEDSWSVLPHFSSVHPILKMKRRNGHHSALSGRFDRRLVYGSCDINGNVAFLSQTSVSGTDPKP